MKLKKPPFAPIPSTIKQLAAICSFFLFWECGADYGSVSGSEDAGPSLESGPVGEKVIPLEAEPSYGYHHATLDSAGKVKPDALLMRVNIENREPGLYALELGTPGNGELLASIEKPGYRSGIYILGEFWDNFNSIYDTLLWFPQNPVPGEKWKAGHRRTMECLSTDSVYYTQALTYGKTSTYGHEVSFQKHRALLIKETRQETETYYYLKKGIGILGYERVSHNKTIETATLALFSIKYIEQDK